MNTASFLGRGFSVVTTLGRTMGRAWDLAARYGSPGFCRNVRACEIPVLELEIPGSAAREMITAGVQAGGRGRRCRRHRPGLRRDGRPGCRTSATGSAYRWWTASPPPPRRCESLVALGLATSTRSEYARPPAKDYAACWTASPSRVQRC